MPLSWASKLASEVSEASEAGEAGEANGFWLTSLHQPQSPKWLRGSSNNSYTALKKKSGDSLTPLTEINTYTRVMETPTRPSSRRSRSSQRSFGAASVGHPVLKRSASLSSSGSIKIDLTTSNIESNNGRDETAIPYCKVTLDNTLPLDYFRQDLVAILQQMKIPKWGRINTNENETKCKYGTWMDINLERISGALSNSIYKVTCRKLPPLLLRIYGAGGESIIDREKELHTLLKLSKLNIGPKLIGIFLNGRLEQFLNNSVTLTLPQIRDSNISKMIARRMKELHQGVSLDLEDRIEGPQAWVNIDKWISILSKRVPELSEEEVVHIFGTTFDKFVELVETYKKSLYLHYNNGLNFFNEIVFCHNDTQYGNLLFYNPEQDDLESIVSGTGSLDLNSRPNYKNDEKLVVIDFEYSGANVPLYDVTNHFSEWMFDYNDPLTSCIADTSRYPTREETLNFIKSYYRSDDGLSPRIIRLYNDCILWRGSNCLFWALWSIVKAKVPEKVKDSEYLELGPNGEKYLITNLQEDDTVSDDDEDSAFTSQNSDDQFDYIKYAVDKLLIFYGDLDQMKIASVDVETELKYLDCELLS